MGRDNTNAKQHNGVCRAMSKVDERELLEMESGEMTVVHTMLINHSMAFSPIPFALPPFSCLFTTQLLALASQFLERCGGVFSRLEGGRLRCGVWFARSFDGAEGMGGFTVGCSYAELVFVLEEVEEISLRAETGFEFLRSDFRVLTDCCLNWRKNGKSSLLGKGLGQGL
jgi:hypothetical protein